MNILSALLKNLYKHGHGQLCGPILQLTSLYYTLQVLLRYT
jgi:hypothetical protein